ncbi:MAG: hypothetical protein Q9210_005933 [Variospora velana]
MLERDDEKHATALKSVEEAKRHGTLGQEGSTENDLGRKEKREAELAREKGAVVNEEGQVVDKRQLLSAGLNAGTAPRARAPAPAKESWSRDKMKNSHDGHRGRETRAFQDQLPGKRGAESKGEDDTDGRASKSRKMEDEILASLAHAATNDYFIPTACTFPGCSSTKVYTKRGGYKLQLVRTHKLARNMASLSPYVEIPNAIEALCPLSAKGGVCKEGKWFRLGWLKQHLIKTHGLSREEAESVLAGSKKG